MPLVRLEVFHLRNLRHALLHFDPCLNLILGPNASGKTSLLEAIYLLARARSFRTSRSTEVIAHGSAWMTVAGKVLQEGREIAVGVGLQGKKRQIKLDDKLVQARAELLQVLPVQFIDPTLHTLFEGAPKLRRKLLDWGVFYAEREFLPAWRRYQRILEQRNAALRHGDAEGAKLWGRELMKYGKIIEDCRSRYLKSLQSEFSQASQRLGLEQSELRYLPGRVEGKDLETAIADDLERDLRFGCTHSGPHRDDFMAYVAGRPVCGFFSRGQMKLLAYALVLAQLRRLGRTACLLIDDLASELDLRNQALLSELIVQLKAQVFITATRPQGLEGLSPPAARIFQVENGVIQAI
jgi:DNA replication and repair protein RecF